MGSFFIGLVIGLVAGGVIVYVYHAKIKKKWEEVQAQAEEAKAQAEKTVDELKKKVDELKN